MLSTLGEFPWVKILVCGLASLVWILLIPHPSLSTTWEGLGHQPGGKTIGGPSRSVLKAGVKKDLLTFIRSGPDPFLFICTTGVNSGSGEVSSHYRTRVGGVKTSTYLPGDSSVACGEATAIFIECHSGPHSQCTFSWRIDVIR